MTQSAQRLYLDFVFQGQIKRQTELVAANKTAQISVDKLKAFIKFFQTSWDDDRAQVRREAALTLHPEYASLI